MNGGLPGPNTTDTVTGGRTLELSKYDKVRKPHKAITDDTKIKITARSLSTELCCPICLDLLTCTMTTKECLHRFCSECITTALMRGNKECPTCRKKIVSKRSLRSDPNFDLLISKIWPDRKLYDAELNASMQLFQEQSNVASLQKSIEDGIRAQAAYRKQRVQGSYDYEKRKRRPKLVDPSRASSAASSSAAADNGGAEADQGEGVDMVEQVVVSLTPVDALEVDSPGGGTSSTAVEIETTTETEADGATPRPALAIATATTAYSSSDESGSTTDYSSDDSSDLSSDSSLSDSSSDLSNLSSTRSLVDASKQQFVSNGQKSGGNVPNLNCSNASSPMSIVKVATESSQNSTDISPDIMKMEEKRRKSEEIELELAPSKALLARGPVPAQLHCSHFIRAPTEITVEHLGEFLWHLNRKATEAELSRREGEGGTNMGTAATAPASSWASSYPPHSSPQPLSSRPECFYILDRCHQLRKLCLQETLSSAHSLSINWERHLTIFFDLLEEANEERNEMAEVVGDELAKMVVREENNEEKGGGGELKIKEEVKEEVEEEEVVAKTDKEKGCRKPVMEEEEKEMVKMEMD